LDTRWYSSFSGEGNERKPTQGGEVGVGEEEGEGVLLISKTESTGFLISLNKGGKDKYFLRIWNSEAGAGGFLLGV